MVASMLTIQDAIEVVTSREYVARGESPDADVREIEVAPVVAALIALGAASRDQARTLALQAVEEVGGRGDVLHPTSDPEQPGELRLWVPAKAFGD
jgi:hypothetical protein